VPDWWYAIVFITMFIAGAIAVEFANSRFPVWALAMALVLAFAYVVPVRAML
jgi:uncharacterized membrane protein YoaK (UPF0700 family)